MCFGVAFSGKIEVYVHLNGHQSLVKKVTGQSSSHFRILAVLRQKDGTEPTAQTGRAVSHVHCRLPYALHVLNIRFSDVQPS
jgi:hypothetical protein